MENNNNNIPKRSWFKKGPGITEILVTALIAYLGFIGIQLISIKTEMSTLIANTGFNKENIDEIGSLIPEYRNNFALKQYKKDIGAAFIVYQASHTKDSQLAMKMDLADFKQGSITKYRVKMDSSKARLFLMAANGVFKGSEEVSFSKMEQYAEIVKDYKKIPSYVLTDKSYLTNEISTELLWLLENKADSIGFVKVDSSYTSWSKLVDIVRENKKAN
ncbi:hypothetical protein [uncultured Aquimarina sp.]|uniref:hypothetical protein n=1 Tax=uncultured Aquimarina sp. TaxID=575652 RepID=UPI0026147A88|nr:hypothetical protein [uncultured Aquimarina sp.]